MRLREQAKAIARFNREIQRDRLIADTIHTNLEKIQQLIETVSKARKTHDTKDIKARLDEVKAIKRYLAKENAILLFLNGVEFRIDLSLPASKNANVYYTKMKKAGEKLEGAWKAAESSKQQIKKYIEKEKQESEAKKEQPAQRIERKKRWFERFKWFKSSEGFIVIGGRDAGTNEIIVKKHMEQNDFFIHADIHGAPAVVIKSEGRIVTETTIDEACQFAATNSIAWKNNAAFLDVYWVKPEQVSKTPESGEYVSRGSFIIRGSRNYRRSKVAHSVGFKIDSDPVVMGGPPRAVEKNCAYYVYVEPGPLKSKDASHRIKDLFLKMATPEDKPLVKRLSIDEINRALPTGGYSITGEKR